MRVPWRAALGGMAVLLSGCGPAPTPISPACTAGVQPVIAALRRAPQALTLPDGFPLSKCVSNGTDDAQLQDVGTVFHQAAEALRVTAREGHDPTAALQLGYLIGATRRGAQHTNGVMAELQRRVELVGGLLQSEAPALAGAVARGLAAGERRG